MCALQQVTEALYRSALSYFGHEGMFIELVSWYLDALSSQANIVKAELLYPSELLLLAQAQCGIEDVHLTPCLARSFVLKSWRHTKGLNTLHTSSPLIVTVPGKACSAHILLQPYPAPSDRWLGARE